jgi:hypothetical protein
MLMSDSMGIILTASAIAGANEWLQTDQVPWRIGIAGLAAALLFDGIERISHTAGVTLSAAVLITALVTPFHGNSPIQEFANVVGKGGQTVKPPTGIKIKSGASLG